MKVTIIRHAGVHTTIKAMAAGATAYRRPGPGYTYCLVLKLTQDQHVFLDDPQACVHLSSHATDPVWNLVNAQVSVSLPEEI